MAAERQNAPGRVARRVAGSAGPVTWRGVPTISLIRRAPLRGLDRVICGVDPHHPPTRGLAGDVRMVTPRKAAMGTRDRRVVGIARETQDDECVALDLFEHAMSPRAGSAPSTAPARTLARRPVGFDRVRGVRATRLSALRLPRARSAEAASIPAGRRVRSSSRDAHADEDVVDLIAVRLTLGAIRQPDEISSVDARDLAKRPPDVTPEVEDTARSPARWRTSAARPVAAWWRLPRRVVVSPRMRRPYGLERSVDVHHLPGRGLAREIGMMPPRQPSMCARDRRVIRVPIDAEDRIGVAAAGLRRSHPAPPRRSVRLRRTWHPGQHSTRPPSKLLVRR